MASVQTDQPKRHRWKRRALIAFVLLLPLQYVAALGPLAWLDRRDYLPEPVSAELRREFRWICRHNVTAARWISRYKGLFR